jgi:succinate dehydrogenase/fumarate reductase-like Fe-S protein
MKTDKCRLKKQGYLAGSCLVETEGKRRLACQATLAYEKDEVRRLISPGATFLAASVIPGISVK